MNARRIDWMPLLVPLLGLIAVWPLLSRPMPGTDDGMLHTLRVVQVDRCLRGGALCLRWAPDMALGYGYPGFNFYLNLPTWIAEGYHLLGLGFVPALAAALTTAVILSGLGAYFLARDVARVHGHAGVWAGLIAAAAYMYAPYQFFDTSYRGNLAETWALAWLPWILWAARRFVTGHGWHDLIPFALIYAAQLYTHNIYTMIGAPVLLGYLLLLWWTSERSLRQAFRLGAMLAFGLALGAFYWLPAIGEQGWVRYTSGMFDYTGHFLTLRELLAAPPAVDTALLNFFPPRSLGWGMLGTLMVGVVLWVFAGLKITPTRRLRCYASPAPPSSVKRGRAIAEWLFFLLVLIAAAFLTLDLSKELWDVLPPLQIVQMPWRFLGLASLAGSLCAGLAFDRAMVRFHPSWQTALVAAALTAIVAAAIPWTYAPSFAQAETLTIADLLRWERDTGLIGTTSINEFLPRWAGMPAELADPTLLDEPSRIAARLDEGLLPAGTQILSATYHILRANLTLDLPQPARVIYKQFYFPGWRVQVDGKPVASVITAPYGLLGIDVPAGAHRVEIRPGTTPLRAAGTALSMMAGVGLIAIWMVERQPTADSRQQSIVKCQVQNDVLRITQYAILFILSLTLFILKTTWIDRFDTPFRGRRFDGQTIPYAGTQTAINLGGEMTLHGYTLPARATPADQPIRVDLYLSTQRPLNTNWMAYARLVDGTGQLWSLRDNGTPDDLRTLPPTSLWPEGMYGHWAYLAYPLPGTPPGEYWIEIALFERDTWRTLPVLDAQGQPAGLTTRIGPLQIGRARVQPSIESLGIATPLNVKVAGSLHALGYTLDRVEAQSGDTLHLTLFWQAAARVNQNWTIDLALNNGETTLPLAQGAAIVSGDSAVPWRAGDVARSQHALRIPPYTPGSTYALQAVVLDDPGKTAAQFEAGQITVHAPQRTMVTPAHMARHVEANLGDRVTLLGFDMDETTLLAGKTLSMTLYWQARQEMDVGYKVFVQLVGANGVLAQIDAIPANDARPTTGWIAGEVIADLYALALPADAPPGEYQLIAGLYDPTTLRRLLVLDAQGNTSGDRVSLSMVQVR